jgi:predicted ATP-dependent serine protease
MTSTVLYCPACHDRHQDRTFCPECGARLEVGEVSKIQPLSSFRRDRSRRAKLRHWIDRLLEPDRGTQILLSGKGGGGKSTLAVEIADAQPGALYVSSEQSGAQVVKIVDRLGLNGKFNYVAIRSSDELPSPAKCPSLVVLDSLSMLAELGYSALAECLQWSTEMAEEGAVVLAIAHVNARGKLAGREIQRHAFDAYLHLSIVAKSRLLRVEKNREGPAPIALKLVMTERGFEIPTDSEIEDARKDLV